MQQAKDYSHHSDQDLKSEHKKLKQKNLLFAFGLGFVVSILVYVLAHGGIGVVFSAVPVWLIILLVRRAKINIGNLKQLQEEFDRRTG